MTVPEFISFLVSLLPFFNAGLVILILDLIFRWVGFEVTVKEYKKKPWGSLFWGLCLILISNILYLLIQGFLFQITNFGVFLILIVAYGITVTNIPAKKGKSK